MAIRSPKVPSSRSTSKLAVKAVELAPARTTAAVKQAVISVDQTATHAANVSTAVKKRTRTTANPSEPSGPRSQIEPPATAMELAMSAPETAVKEVEKRVDMASQVSAKAGAAVTAMAAHSTKSPGPRAQSTVAAKATALAAVPVKAVANEAVSVVDKVRKGATAATESAKAGTAHAIDTYKNAATKTLDSTEEIVKAAGDVVAGATEIHQMIWTSMQRALQTAVEMPAQFATCTSFAELAQAQQDLMRRGFNEWLNISQEILMANRRIADRAIHTLELR